MAIKWRKNGDKNGVKMATKWQNGDKMAKKCDKNGVKMATKTKWRQNGDKMR